MSLDVYLEGIGTKPIHTGIFVREEGRLREITRDEWDQKFPGREPATFVADDDDDLTLFHANITHNLGRMADAAGIYDHLWAPENIGVANARDLIEPLRAGLERLKANPDAFKVHNPSNGWGDYTGLVAFVAQYLIACEANPDATIRVSR